MRVGETISLAPKAIEILILLVVRAGELVEKDELLRAVWPDTFVEESNLTQNIFTLRRALGDERVSARYIETVARRGYRFIARVRPIGADDNGEARALAASERSVIAVLPFLNTSGDQELEYLAEGITDNIINNLSRVSRLRVMSRSAVFRYHTKEAVPQKAGRQLGADTVLVGKINARASAITITVELVDVSTGWQLWGESFDSQSRDILQIQDAITRQLLATLRLNLTGAEEKSVTARYTESAQAYQSYLEGRYHWSRYTRKGIEKAINKAAEYVRTKKPGLKIEVEARSIDDVKKIVELGKGKVFRILIDNFRPEDIDDALALIKNDFETEASGGITLDNIEEFAKTGVDYISSGALIHQAKSLDLSLKAVIL